MPSFINAISDILNQGGTWTRVGGHMASCPSEEGALEPLLLYMHKTQDPCRCRICTHGVCELLRCLGSKLLLGK